MRTIQSLSSRQWDWRHTAWGMMGVLLIGRIDHRAYPDNDQAEGVNDCGCDATQCVSGLLLQME
jgi:hypothetical protein